MALLYYGFRSLDTSNCYVLYLNLLFVLFCFVDLQELEKIAIELEEEKMKIENTARELLDEHERTKQ